MVHFDFSKYENIFLHSQFDNKVKHLYDSNKEANNFFTAFLKDKRNNDVVKYLENRGLNTEIIDHFKIGYAPAKGDVIADILTNHDNMFGDNHDKSLI
jgi:DNA primase